MFFFDFSLFLELFHKGHHPKLHSKWIGADISPMPLGDDGGCSVDCVRWRRLRVQS